SSIDKVGLCFLIRQDIAKAINVADVRARMEQQGAVPLTIAPEQFDVIIRNDTVRRRGSQLGLGNKAALHRRLRSLSPSLRAAFCASCVSSSAFGLAGFTSRPMTAALGTASRIICSLIAPVAVPRKLTPVILPSGRLRL